METITSTHQEWKLFSRASKRIVYRNKCLKQGPSFAIKLKKQAESFCLLYCGNLFHLVVEAQTYLTIWFEEKQEQESNFPYSLPQGNETALLQKNWLVKV